MKISDYARKTQDTIRQQPGYSRLHPEIMLAYTIDGGIRLYTRINGRWMDGSLADIPPTQISARDIPIRTTDHNATQQGG